MTKYRRRIMKQRKYKLRRRKNNKR